MSAGVIQVTFLGGAWAALGKSLANCFFKQLFSDLVVHQAEEEMAVGVVGDAALLDQLVDLALIATSGELSTDFDVLDRSYSLLELVQLDLSRCQHRFNG